MQMSNFGDLCEYLNVSNCPINAANGVYYVVNNNSSNNDSDGNDDDTDNHSDSSSDDNQSDIANQNSGEQISEFVKLSKIGVVTFAIHLALLNDKYDHSSVSLIWCLSRVNARTHRSSVIFYAPTIINHSNQRESVADMNEWRCARSDKLVPMRVQNISDNGAIYKSPSLSSSSSSTTELSDSYHNDTNSEVSSASLDDNNSVTNDESITHPLKRRKISRSHFVNLT